MAKIKQKVDIPKQSSSFVINLPQPSLRNADEYLKAYTGYVYTAVGAIAEEAASIDLHLYEIKYGRDGKPKTQEIYQHPSLSVLHYVNRIATFYELVEATQIYLELLGEAFWVVLKNGTMPSEIWLIRPDWVKIIPSATEVIDHYDYFAGGVMTEKVSIPRDNVIPFKYFNPRNPYRGKGSVQAAALPFDILNFAQEYNRNFFFNSAIPSMVFSSDQKISQATVERFLTQWQNSFGGRSKSNKVAFLGNGMKLDKASFGAKELDFANQLDRMRDDVLAVFKVPKTILGMTNDVNLASARATTMAFMERVITPRMKKFTETLNEFYLPMFEDSANLFFDFTDPSPQDVELQLKKYESGRRFTWMTPNEIRVEENMEPLVGGDDLFAPLGGSASPFSGLGGGEQGDGGNLGGEPLKSNSSENTEGGKGLKASLIKLLGGEVIEDKTYTPPASLQRLINRPIKHNVKVPMKRPEKIQQEELAAKFVEPLKKFIGDLIKEDNTPLKKEKENEELKDVFLEALEEAKKKKAKENDTQGQSDTEKHSKLTDEQKDLAWKKFIEKADKDEKNILTTSKEIFGKQEKVVIASLEDHLKSWRKRLGIKATPTGIIPSLSELGAMWTALQKVLETIYVDQGNQTLSNLGIDGEINITTEFAVEYLDNYAGVLIEQIDTTTRDKLQTTLSEGFDAGEGIDKLKKRVQEVFVEADSNRAEIIARSEAIKASNAASVEAYRQSGVVEAKEWLAERDDRTCDYCLELDGKAIGLNKMFFEKGDEFTVNGQTLTIELADVGEPPIHAQCFDNQTEVLTNEGWKLFKDVRGDEKILSVNLNDGDSEWVDIKEKVEYMYTGEMVSYKNAQNDLMVTPNHNQVVRFREKQKGRTDTGIWKIVEEKLLPNNDFNFLGTIPNYKGKDIDEMMLGNMTVSTFDFVRFMAMYLSDGSITKRKDKENLWQLSIACIKNNPTRQEVEILLEKLFENIGRGEENVTVSLSGDRILIAEYLDKFGHSLKKYIPQELKELDKEYLEEFLDTYSRFDGSVKKGKLWKGYDFSDSVVYFTSSDQMAADLGELILKVGDKPSYRKSEGKYNEFKNGNYYSNPCWRINHNTRTTPSRNGLVKEIYHYDDYVYDVELVKYHTLFVRRNGKVLLSGNCRCTVIPVIIE